MIRLAAIVGVSSTYSGIFFGTEMLYNIQYCVQLLAEKVGIYGGMVLISILTSAVSCNQTFAIMLTKYLYDGIYSNASQMAIAMEDTSTLGSLVYRGGRGVGNYRGTKQFYGSSRLFIFAATGRIAASISEY